MPRYSLKELDVLVKELAGLLGLEGEGRSDPARPGALYIRTRDSRVGGVEVCQRGTPDRPGYRSYGISGTSGNVGEKLEAAIVAARTARETRPPLPEGAIVLSAEQAAALKEAMRHLYNFTNGRAHQRITGAQLALEKAAPIFDPAELRQTAAELRAAGHDEGWIAELVAAGSVTAE
jgi:hypothetical protein